MNDRALSQYYVQFSVEERVRLTLAAMARKDKEEVARLRKSCPRTTFVGPDPRYSKSLDKVWDAVVDVAGHWLTASHYLVRAKLEAWGHSRVASQCAAGIGEARRTSRRTRELEAAVREYVALAEEAKAKYESWCAEWKGIESATTRFCGEIGLTLDQFFAIAKPLPSSIGDARQELDANIPVNLEVEAEVYRELRQAWFGEEESRQQNDPQSAGGVPPKAENDEAENCKTISYRNRSAGSNH